MRFIRVLGAAVLALSMLGSNAFAALQIEITGGINEGRRVLVLPFLVKGEVPVDVSGIISNDLMRSGKFTPLSVKQLPAGALVNNSVNFDVLAAQGIEAVVSGEVGPVADTGNYQVAYQLYGVQGSNKGKPLTQRRGITTNASQLRQAAHLVSDRTYELLTGQRGAFRTRIAYIVYRHGDRFPYQLMTADYDGYNEVPVLRSTEPIMTPNWSPDGKRLVYVSFERRAPTIFVQDIFTKKRTKLASFPGLNSSPSWSPDGSKIAFTLSKDGQPEIYYYDLVTSKYHRVTKNRAIDTEPSWSYDNKRIYFTSERGGRAQIYSVDIETREAQRTTVQGAMNLSSRPIPGSDALIVITRQNGYRVARMDADGSIYMLTTSSLDESPSVAPNGSMVIYSTVYQGRKGLALVSTDGRFKANLPSSNKGEISAPAWGPLPEK
ncbi:MULTISPECIES: Tol-Pal system beta propeller repeat protein TolB [unclassified Anaerobiospirillum]|uniref:Tol-Pal system beta propeller repeat protein TolB n=1 Tax=unclassified Anaerobiospirillum TaxID=2647410 RepID=UPI001FF58A46|nr:MULTISPECIES: Tol-Pal system beta propeller repeat protein TolB [unclassified Anaerobiospirillum]MCK0525647.1 Tol-Pal system beta propeller repeat protein TolB [Anaerobiospirillum sp. NML120449]MCK0533734.1 Tol-Pal system beta propeller repeat protein TolB [Anaerobiospirillum sp. NML120511]MCK0540025.1 Tol-Pal system beta propeller repeat protein TolB [Anaerobiospirillum sp. NML02-A-032]